LRDKDFHFDPTGVAAPLGRRRDNSVGWFGMGADDRSSA
jgi:hypothetical protein